MDEFQNFSTESFETILSDARKYRLNLVLANQFMTQLTDKIREGILGNVGTIMSGRLGVTDAELMEKAFSPVFNAEDLHKLANHSAIATVMMFGVPSSPFTMKLLPPMGDENPELLKTLKAYSAAQYGRPRAEVNREIDARLAASEEPKIQRPEEHEVRGAAVMTGRPVPKPVPQKNFLDSWLEKKASLEQARKTELTVAAQVGYSPASEVAKARGGSSVLGSQEPFRPVLEREANVTQVGGKKLPRGDSGASSGQNDSSVVASVDNSLKIKHDRAANSAQAKSVEEDETILRLR